ncbi:Heat shock protein DnaJ N-terminal [Penicillium taxi]|uniref:Heat shock protein DnaJ N-terminal n=1 Tax=Penicillium taxi TaxID=168475 RepID=UPI0025455E1B|nr:Heat shock protein DnaJ N-terminal [Penicillium taxi]KAJ5895091.1 Heat shock protein DnaJ N-terminal [Penicillium taxi]
MSFSRVPTIALDFYRVLELPERLESSLSKEEIKERVKAAYFRALLKHHPDRAQLIANRINDGTDSSSEASNVTGSNVSNVASAIVGEPTWTVDQITTAYKTLKDHHLRVEYDSRRRLDSLNQQVELRIADEFFDGTDIIHLDDMICDEALDLQDHVQWFFYPCRCGDSRGYIVSEWDLQEELEVDPELSDIIVPCRTCSLFVKVHLDYDSSPETTIEEENKEKEKKEEVQEQ